MHKIFDNVKLVVFDVMGVILSQGSLVKKGLYPLYENQYPYEFVKELYNKVRHNPDGDISLWEGLQENDYINVRKKVLDSYTLDPEYDNFKNRLLEEGKEVAILSNMPKEWAEYLSGKFGFDKDFSFSIFSGIVGLKKPEIEIYEYLTHKAKNKPNEMIFIDDKLKNLQPANQLGMKTIHYKRGEDDFDFTPDLRIDSYAELY